MKTIHHVISNGPQDAQWVMRHRSAVHRGLTQSLSSISLGACIVQGINAWCEYASSHARRYEGQPIGQDYVLGDMWKAWGFALRGLLNGETGELDCGTLDQIIVGNIMEQFPEEVF